MKYEVSEQSPVEREIHLFPEAADLDKHMSVATEHLSKEVKLPGFRKGKVPEHMIRKQFAETLDQSCAEEIVAIEIPIVLKEKGWQIFEPGMYIKRDEESGKFIHPDGKIVVFIECLPEEDVSVPEFQLEKEEVRVEESELQQEIEHLKQQYAEIKPIIGSRPAQVGDVLVLKTIKVSSESQLDVPESVASESDSETESEESKKDLFWYELVQKEGEQQDPLLGIRVGEIRSIEDPMAPQEAGLKSIVVKRFICKDVCQKVLPELNEDLAIKVGGFKTVEDLKGQIRKAISFRKSQEIVAKNRRTIMEKVVETNNLPVPASLYKRMLHEQMRMNLSNLERAGVRIEKEELDAMLEKSKPTFQKEADLMAKFTVFTAVYSKKYGLKVEDPEVDHLYQTLNSKAKKTETKISEVERLRFKQLILQEKVLSDLKNKSTSAKAGDGV